MKFRINPTPDGEHVWFAWYPVVARRLAGNHYERYIVWLQDVKRTRVSSAKLSQWLYEV